MIYRERTADFSAMEAFYASVGYFQAITADCIVISRGMFVVTASV
jgi:hypothetical protein